VTATPRLLSVNVGPARLLRVGDRTLLSGIRIEDDAVVTESGCELLTRGVPVAVDEIEALMRA